MTYPVRDEVAFIDDDDHMFVAGILSDVVLNVGTASSWYYIV